MLFMFAAASVCRSSSGPSCTFAMKTCRAATALALLVATGLAGGGHSFFVSTRAFLEVNARQSKSLDIYSIWVRRDRETSLTMTETEGKGTPSREARGSGTAKGKGGGRDTQTAEGRKKRGSMVPGPPRLENVPGDKLDEVLLFREERPNKTPKVIECYADRYAVVGGRRYVVGHPCDWSVSLCIPKGQDGVEPIPLESDLMQELLPGLQRELEEEDVHLFDTPVTLTLQGDFLAEGEDYDEDDEDDDGDEEQEAQQAGESGGQIDFEVLDQGDGTFDGDPGDEEEVEDRIPTDIEEEGVEHIASYWYEGEEYSLVKHNDPTFVIARQAPDGYLLLGPKEGDMVRPRIEAMMLRELQVTQAVEGALGDDLERELDSAFKKAGGEEADWSKLLPEVDTE